MADLWTRFKTYFQEAETSSPSKPLVHELIARTDEEIDDYRQWRDMHIRQQLTGWLDTQFTQYRQTGRQSDRSIDFLDTPSSKGFVIHFGDLRYSLRDTRHFADYLKERVRTLNYRTQISDLRTYQNGPWVETIERHYLKPRPGQPQDPEKQFVQRYGNVMIENVLRDEKPYRLKFRATVYQDRLFEEAKSFDKLVSVLVV